MKPNRIGMILVACAILRAGAAVTPLCPERNVFLDAAHGLPCSQPNAFAASNCASAQAAVSTATIAGFSGCVIPSIEQFGWLYLTQGTTPSVNPNPDYDEIMVAAPPSGGTLAAPW